MCWEIGKLHATPENFHGEKGQKGPSPSKEEREAGVFSGDYRKEGKACGGARLGPRHDPEG